MVLTQEKFDSLVKKLEDVLKVRFDSFCIFYLAIQYLPSGDASLTRLHKQNPFGFASFGDGNRHPQLVSPPTWVKINYSTEVEFACLVTVLTAGYF